jgi:hypothetical protein
MDMLRIKAVQSAAQPGNFGAKVVGRELTLPEKVASAFAAHGVRNATDLVSYLHTFPSAIAADLQWNVADVLRGLDVLSAQLSGLVEDDVLSPPPRPRVHFGARNPMVRKATK